MTLHTPSQTVGPFFGLGLPYAGGDQLVAPGTPGAVRLEGQVLDGAGEPVPDALLEVWQAGPDGSYDPGMFGRCRTDAEGAFSFVTVKPGCVALSDGRLQAPHLNLSVFARGLLAHLVTRVYFPDEEEANADDPVLTSVSDAAARDALVARSDGGVLHFDVRLQGEGETAFFAL